MLQRDDLLRMARIIDYDRFFTPSLGMMNDPSFEYEYVHSAIRKTLDTGGYCITWQSWKKAQKGSAYDPCISENEMKRKMQHNEVRARKEMKTSELRTMLETLPLQFSFDSGMSPIKVVVLPKLANDPHKVYVRWSTNRDLYCEQYSLDWRTDLHKKWFNLEKANSEIGKDWRYLLHLNNPDTTPLNVLYKIFDGVYTGDIDFRLVKGTELYTKEHFPDGPLSVEENAEIFDARMEEKNIKNEGLIPYIKGTKSIPKRIKSKPTFKLCCDEEKQKMVCIKDPENGNIIRIAKYFTGKFLKNGFTFASKEEYKLQQKLKFEKRKDMAEGNREAQLLKYTGKPRSQRRFSKQRGIAGSPYNRYQTITIEELDKKDKSLIAQEKIQVKRIVPQYEYVPMVWEIKKDGVVIETIPFLYPDGKPKMRKVFIENKEEWFTITRNVPTVRKTIKVLQIPSKKITELKSAMSEVKFSKLPEGALLNMPVVKSQRTKFLLSEDKNGRKKWEEIYSDPTIK